MRRVDDRHGDERELWTRAGVVVQPPPSGVECPECGCDQLAMFPAGYLARHPELFRSAEPEVPDPAPLRSPVPKRLY